MTTACQPTLRITTDPQGPERREFRRHDLESHGIRLHRYDGGRRSEELGEVVDLSAGGVRIRMDKTHMRPDQQVRVRLELPVYAGISPFVDTSSETPRPKREWVGWMTVARVEETADEQVDVAGRLVDMEDIDRGMLSLYLSTHPLAA